MSAAVGVTTDSSSSSENGDQNNAFDQVPTNDDNTSYKGEINDEINENSPAECITYTSTPVTHARSNKRKRKNIPIVDERKTYP